MSKSYFNLQGKVVLVTGASSGIGAHFASVLAAEGANVILAARRAEKLQEQVDAIIANGGKARAISMDVASTESVNAAFEIIKSEYGKLEVLVNNAGVAGEPIKFLDTSEDDWNWVINTNLNGAWRVAKAAVELMIAGNIEGAVVNTASIYGLRTGVLKSAYNASKAALVQLTKSMAMELSRKNIRVNALCPGWIDTGLNDEYFASENGKRYIQTIPAKRLGTVEDLTVAMLLLACNSAGAYITGTTLTVDGGICESPI